MIIKLDDNNDLEIEDNQARIIQNGKSGSWLMFSTDTERDIKVESKAPNLVIISYGEEKIRLRISGTTISNE